jgi:asparagine synthase (glutamine-hydrolysing)
VSAVAGLVHLDGRPVDLALLRVLAVPPAGSPVDRLEVWHDGSAGFAHALAQVTPEAASERQPLVDPETGCVIAFDGRLDNRAELGAVLGEHGRLLGEGSDAAHVLAAYLRWDRDAPGRLLGDFAFAVWDPRVRRLLLARDPVGVRPLYYAPRPEGIAFASTLEQLLADPALPRDLDEATVLWFLYDNRSPLPGPTYYRHVRVVPGGHRLEVEPGRTRLARYADWPDGPAERRLDPARDADELRHLLLDAVRGRLRSERPVAVTLSGGLDSGAVACVAGLLRETEGRTPIHAYSMVFERLTSADERRYSGACAARYGFAHTLVPVDDLGSLSRLEQWRPAFHEPFLGLFDDTHLEVLARARADGLRAVMTGNGGDHLFTGSPDYLSGWLIRGRLGALHRQASARARVRRRGYLLAVADGALRPWLPSWLQARVQASRGQWPAGAEAWLPAHLDAQYRPATRPPVHWGPNGWWHGLRDVVAAFGQTPNGAHWHRVGRMFGLEVRNPLTDVRLVRFALSAPPDAFYRDGLTKWLLRRSLHDVLPPLVRDRSDKASFVPLSADGLRHRRPFVEALLADSELERRGYLRPEPWRRAIRVHLDAGGPVTWAAWRSLTLEMWLRLREGRLPAVA